MSENQNIDEMTVDKSVFEQDFMQTAEGMAGYFQGMIVVLEAFDGDVPFDLIKVREELDRARGAVKHDTQQSKTRAESGVNLGKVIGSEVLNQALLCGRIGLVVEQDPSSRMVNDQLASDCLAELEQNIASHDFSARLRL